MAPGKSRDERLFETFIEAQRAATPGDLEMMDSALGKFAARCEPDNF